MVHYIDKYILQDARERIAQTRQWDVQLVLQTPQGASLIGAEVEVRLTQHAFRFGCGGFELANMADGDLLAAYEERFLALLNYAILPFYWSGYEPERGVTQEATLRKQAAWCQAHGLRTKGHPLAWDITLPEWTNGLPDDEVVDLQRRRVREIVGGFRGLIETWDVVNEPNIGDRHHNAVGRWMARNPAAMVADLLNCAHEANPDAELVCNDYNIYGIKWEELIRYLIDDYNAYPPGSERVLTDLQQMGAPFQVIGLQSHMHHGAWPLEKVWEICERHVRFGLPLHWTELTIVSGAPKARDDRSFGDHEGWVTTPQGEQAQLEDGEAIYTLLYSHPAVECITWWELSDYQSWQKAPCGLVRADMSPKPLYSRLMELIWGEWATRYDGVLTGATLGVRCAAGEHRVVAKLPSGATLSGTFTVHKGEQGPIVVSLA